MEYLIYWNHYILFNTTDYLSFNSSNRNPFMMSFYCKDVSNLINKHNLKPLNTGFSLIELMITLMIIGLIASIALPNYSFIQKKSKEKAVIAIAHSLSISIESYYLSTGYYPEYNHSFISDIEQHLINSGILHMIHTNPFTGQTYSSTDQSGSIYYTGTTAGYTISVYGFNNDTILLVINNA